MGTNETGHYYAADDVDRWADRLQSFSKSITELDLGEGLWRAYPYSVAEPALSLFTTAMGLFLEAVKQRNWLALATPINELQELIDLKLRPMEEYLITLVELLYRLSCGFIVENETIGPDPRTRARIAELLAKILKKNKKLLCKKFVFDHRPLLETAETILFPPPRTGATLVEEQNIDALIDLVLMARRWFDEGGICSALSVDKGFAHITADHDQMSRFLCLAVMFTPSKGPHVPLLTKLLEPKSVIWSTSSKRLETILMVLLARTIKNLSFTSSENAESLVHADSLKFFFGIFIKHLRLNQPEKTVRKRDRLFYYHQVSLKMVLDHLSGTPRVFGKIVAYAITNKVGSIMSELGILMAGLESYFHPSNSGTWTESLSTFVSVCCQLVAKNVGLGRSALEDDLRIRFAEMMWPAAERLSMSKNPYISIGAATTIKWLAFLDSGQGISRSIRSNAALTLTNLCEPHRTLSCLMVLGRVARLELETGASGDKEYCSDAQDTSLTVEVNYLDLLLQSTIGIDYNDPFKTVATLNLFTNALMTLPFDDKVASMEYFEELVSVLLERSFAYIESLSQSRRQKDGGSLEHLILAAFAQTWMEMFAQMPKTLWRFAMNRLRLFLSEARGGAGGGEMVARLTLACKGRYVKEALDGLLPPLLGQLSELLDTSMGRERQGEDSSCATLIWTLSAICGLLRYSGNVSITWKGDLLRLLPGLIQLRQERCVDLVCKLIKSCARSWCDYYPWGVPGWECDDDRYRRAREGFAAYPVRLTEVDFEWSSPTEASKAAAREFCDRLSQALPFSIGDMKSHLKYRLLLTRLLTIVDPATSRIETELDQVLDVALDESQTLDVRSLAMAILDTSIDYVGYSNYALHEARLRTRTLIAQLQRYHREKALPPLIQEIRHHELHKRLQILLRGAGARRLRSGLAKRVLLLCLSPHGSIRRPAQSALVKIFQAYPVEGQRFVLDDLIPKALEMAQEGSLKGAIHTIKQFQGSLVASFSSAQRVLEHCLLILRNHGTLPKLADFTIQAVRDLSLGIYPRDPSLADPIYFGNMLSWVISVYQDPRSSWKVQAITIFLISILSGNTRDAGHWETIIKFIMDCLCSENAEVRSLAVNHGSRLLHRWHLILPNPTTNKFLVQHVGLVLEQSMKYLAQEYHPFSPSGATREGHQALHFRYDCAHFIWSLAEVIGAPLVELIEAAFSKLSLDASPAHIRATAEVYSGCLRGLLPRRGELGDNLILSLMAAMARKMSESGTESMDVWYEAGHTIACDGINTNDSTLLLEWFLAQRSREVSLSTVSQAVHLRFLAGLLRDATGYEDGRLEVLCADAINSSFDMLRVSAIKLCLGSPLRPHLRALEVVLGCNPIPDKSPLARSCLIVAEYLTMDPGRGGFWRDELMMILLRQLFPYTTSSDANLQNEAKRVVKLLSWAGLLPVQKALPMIKGILQLVRDSDPSIGSRKYLVECLRLFYGRNLLACYQLGPSLLEEQLTMDENLEVRLEAAELCKLIFHSNANLAGQWSRRIIETLNARRASPTQLHGWILMASSLVLSSPYDIPAWMPQVLTLLTRFLGERHPIQGTVRQTFSEFKRTHGDTWEQDRAKFAEDQLDAINELLVAPSYYA